MSSRQNVPDAIAIPKSNKDLVDFGLETIQKCRISVPQRLAYCQFLNTLVKTGAPTGERAILNPLMYHEDRLAAHLYSPTQLHFTISSEHSQPKSTLLKMHHAGKVLTEHWERNNIDTLFAQGVKTALRYGCAHIKQWCTPGDTEGSPNFCRSLVMPWQFGVLLENINELSRQPAFVETMMLSPEEVWHRIYRMDNAKELFKQIYVQMQPATSAPDANNFLTQIFSTATINTTQSNLPNPSARVGGFVNIGNHGNYVQSGPEIGTFLVPMHELWVWDGADYTTIQIIEPDILIYPTIRKDNALIPNSQLNPSRLQPYRRICPNDDPSYYFGRSEFEDMIEPQAWLASSAVDAKRLLGLQVDKFFGFVGDENITDETMNNFRESGFVQVGNGMSIQDLTPKFPPELLPLMEKIESFMDKIGGFGNIMDGQGSPGVRADAHAQTLIKTASPTLRDRSLIVERQCAEAADLTLSLFRAKEATTYYYDAEKPEETSYTFGALPDDCIAQVDSHSSSPIFADDHIQLVFAGVKAGIIDGEDALELLPLPNKELLRARLRERKLQQAAQLEQLRKEDPEAYAKVLAASKRH